MPSDDENLNQSQKNKAVPMDLRAGHSAGSTAGSVVEEGIHGVDLCGECKTSTSVEVASDVISAGATCDAAACDVKALADSQPSEPVYVDVQSDDIQSSQERDEVLLGENKLTGDDLDKGESHGLRKRRGTKVAPSDLSVSSFESVVDKISEDEKGGAPIESGQDPKSKSAEKKSGKQGKSAGKATCVRRVGDTQVEERAAKEEVDINRRLPEPLDNLFFRQTIRCEPFNSRPADKPLQCLRPDVFEKHVTGKFAKSYRTDVGHDPRSDGMDDTSVLDSHNVDVDVSKGASSSFAKGMGGLGRGLQHPRPSGMAAFAQAAGRSTADLPGWLPASKVMTAKCDKCPREFGSSLNHRRHARVHRRSLNPEKEDVSKQRSKVAAFWDKLTPEEASSIVHYDNMEIEDLSGQQTVDSLTKLLQHSGSTSLSQGILGAGRSLLDIVQGKPSPLTLSSERLFSILDDATERTFLYGGTSVSVQRFAFNNDPKAVGLEERNLVATLGFHIELELVKAWMADKEAEALRCQQALFNEEEAAEKKRTKLLEKKRMKKKREKKRKGGPSQSSLQDLENESIDDEGNVQGVAEEDDSPLATGSSSSSVASAQDLTHPDYGELDVPDKSVHTGTNDEHLQLGIDTVLEEGTSRDEILHHEQDELDVRAASPEVSEFSPKIESQPSQEMQLEISAPSEPLRATEKSALDDADARQVYASHGKNERSEVQSGAYFRKVEQERGSSDPRRREFERPSGDRKSLRIPRVASRDEFVDPMQRSGRNLEMRYADTSQTLVKPLRKGGGFPGKNDTGPIDFSRVHQYRSKLSGLSRGQSVTGARQGIWTRKVTQTAVVETGKAEKQGVTPDEIASGCVADVVSSEESDPCPEALSQLPPDAQGLEANTDADTALASNIILGEVSTTKGEDLQERRDDSASVPELQVPMVDEAEACDAASSGALLVGSLSVPLGKFATMGATQPRLGPEPSSLRPDETDVFSASAVGISSHRGRSEPPSSSRWTSLTTDYYPDPDAERHDPAQQGGFVSVKSFDSRTQSIATQTPKLKSSCSPASPEKGDFTRYNSAMIGPHERLSLKQTLWQTTVGRAAASKVWRPVGTVIERHDSTEFRSSRVDSDFTSAEDVDLSGTSDNDQEISPMEGLQPRGPHEDVESRDVSESLDRGGREAAAKVNSVEESDVKPRSDLVEAFLGERRESGEDVIDDKEQSNTEEDYTDPLASDARNMSAVLDNAKSFLKTRWDAAFEGVSSDDILDLKLTDNAPAQLEDYNFLDAIMQHNQSGSKHHPGAVLVSALSASICSESSGGKSRNLGAEFPSVIFNESYRARLEDATQLSIPDQRRIAGATLQTGGALQTPVSGADVRMRDANTSPVLVTENYINRNWAIKGSCGSEAHRSILRLSGGTLDSAHGIYGVGKEDRWVRNPRDRFPEARYMPRRRVPTGRTY